MVKKWEEETLASPGPIKRNKISNLLLRPTIKSLDLLLHFHLPSSTPKTSSLFLSNGGFSSHLEASPELRLPFDPGQLPSPRALHRSSESHKPLIGSGQMGLPRSENDNSTRSVAPEDRRRRLRGAKRGLGGTGQGLRRSLRLARLGPPRRSQQDHRRLLLQCSGTVCPPRRLVFPHRFCNFLNFHSLIFGVLKVVSFRNFDFLVEVLFIVRFKVICI